MGKERASWWVRKPKGAETHPVLPAVTIGVSSASGPRRRGDGLAQNYDTQSTLIFADVLVPPAIPGGDSGGDTPVPIPNTEVKPSSADGTALETRWESRTLPGFCFCGPPNHSRGKHLFKPRVLFLVIFCSHRQVGCILVVRAGRSRRLDVEIEGD